MSGLERPLARNALAAIAIIALSVAALLASVGMSALDPQAYIDYMGQNGIYAQITSALASGIITALPQDSRIAPTGDVVNRLSKYIGQGYVKGQVDLFVTGTVSYVEGSSAGFSPQISLTPVKGKISQAIIESYITTRDLQITDPEQQKIIALQQDAIVKLIPDTIGREQIMASKDAAGAYAIFEQSLGEARGYAAMARVAELVLAIIAIAAIAGIYISIGGLYGFFQFVWKPLAICAGAMFAASMLLQLAGGIAFSAIAGQYAQDPQVAQAVSGLISHILSQAGLSNAMFGIAMILLACIAYALGKYIFSPPEFRQSQQN
ncbi:MAG: hypothetical protein WC506_05135 [Candidatus Micrarchaeia archaeon]